MGVARVKPEIDYIKLKYLIYGQPKSGKSTFVSQFASVDDIIFFPTEEGHKFLDINKWTVEKKTPTGTVSESPSKWQHFKECAAYLITQPHNFKTLVIDTSDNLAEWCMSHICKEHDIEHESDLGFGKGYKFASREMFTVFNALTMKGIGVIFISHEKTSEINGAKNIKKTYTDTTMSSTAKKLIQGMVDFILYFYIDEDGNRKIRTKGNDYINAGDRSGLLPEVVPMNPKIMEHAITEATKSEKFKEYMKLKQEKEFNEWLKIQEKGETNVKV